MTITELIHLLERKLAKHGDLTVRLGLHEGEFELKLEVTDGPEMTRSEYGTLSFPSEKRLLITKKEG